MRNQERVTDNSGRMLLWFVFLVCAGYSALFGWITKGVISGQALGSLLGIVTNYTNLFSKGFVDSSSDFLNYSFPSIETSVSEIIIAFVLALIYLGLQLGAFFVAAKRLVRCGSWKLALKSSIPKEEADNMIQLPVRAGN